VPQELRSRSVAIRHEPLVRPPAPRTAAPRQVKGALVLTLLRSSHSCGIACGDP
jgi:hypothetical protein